MGWRHANDGGQPAEPIVAADRFAPKIIHFLTQSLACARGPLNSTVIRADRKGSVALPVSWLSPMLRSDSGRRRCGHFRFGPRPPHVVRELGHGQGISIVCRRAGHGPSPPEDAGGRWSASNRALSSKARLG